MSDATESHRTRKLLRVAGAGLLGVLVFGILHNVLYGLSRMTDAGILRQLLGFLDGACFLLAVFACPALSVVCVVWAIVDRFGRHGSWSQRLLRLALPLAAVALVCYFLAEACSFSKRETDATAGFNGSFEAVKSGYPANWYIYHKPLEEGDAELDYDDTDPVDGTQSLRFVVHRAAPAGGWHSPGLFQLTDAEEGGSYRVSFWLKNQGCHIRLVINSETAESLEPRNPIYRKIGPEQTGEGAWKQFVYDYTVPAHYANIRFELNLLAPGTVWIDDVRITPLTAPSTAAPD